MVATSTRRVGIFIYPQAEVLDFCGPYEVFTTATRVGRRLAAAAPAPFEVLLIAESEGIVGARAGFEVRAHCAIDAHPPLDVLIVAGGVATAELSKPRVIDWIRRTAGRCELTASVCTGAFLLGKAGLLDGRSATTHWEDIDDLAGMLPSTRVLRDTPWVDTGPVVTSAGISAGIDMSLHLVERLTGRALAEATARQMDYRWRQA